MDAKGKVSHRASDSLLSCQSRRKEGKMTNILHTDSNEEVTVEFIKDNKELFDKTQADKTEPGSIVCGKASTTAENF